MHFFSSKTFQSMFRTECAGYCSGEGRGYFSMKASVLNTLENYKPFREDMQSVSVTQEDGLCELFQRQSCRNCRSIEPFLILKELCFLFQDDFYKCTLNISFVGFAGFLFFSFWTLMCRLLLFQNVPGMMQLLLCCIFSFSQFFVTQLQKHLQI